LPPQFLAKIQRDLVVNKRPTTQHGIERPSTLVELRQDPDVILVGETRDQVTAELMIRAALTGHLVFSTLHTNDAISAVPRLTDLGIPPYLLSSSLIGLSAQRLARRLCPVCKSEHSLSPDEWLAFKNPSVLALLYWS